MVVGCILESECHRMVIKSPSIQADNVQLYLFRKTLLQAVWFDRYASKCCVACRALQHLKLVCMNKPGHVLTYQHLKSDNYMHVFAHGHTGRNLPAAAYRTPECKLPLAVQGLAAALTSVITLCASCNLCSLFLLFCLVLCTSRRCAGA